MEGQGSCGAARCSFSGAVAQAGKSKTGGQQVHLLEQSAKKLSAPRQASAPSLCSLKAQNAEHHRALSEIIVLRALPAVPSLLQSCLLPEGRAAADTDSKEVLQGMAWVMPQDPHHALEGVLNGTNHQALMGHCFLHVKPWHSVVQDLPMVLRV